MADEQVTIPKKELKVLKERNLFLSALEQVGVDGWEGYSDAQELYEEFEPAIEERLGGG